MVRSGHYEKAKPRGVSESDEHSADDETAPPLSIQDEQIVGLAMMVSEYSPKCVKEMIDLTRIFGHHNRLVLILLMLKIVTVRNLRSHSLN